MGQRDVCTFRLAQRAAYRTAISAAQTCHYTDTIKSSGTMRCTPWQWSGRGLARSLQTTAPASHDYSPTLRCHGNCNSGQSK